MILDLFPAVIAVLISLWQLLPFLSRRLLPLKLYTIIQLEDSSKWNNLRKWTGFSKISKSTIFECIEFGREL